MPDPQRLEIDVVVRRGRVAESRHRIQAAVVDAQGTGWAETAGAGDVTTFRSAAKPFQLLPLVERGHADRWGWSDPDLAVMAASHTGSPDHIALVSGILARIGVPVAALACGFHEPADPVSRERLRTRPQDRSPLFNNCSGKHAGMLCLAVSEGWPIEGYETETHPVQQLMRRTVAEVCGLRPEDLVVAVDGCSVSVFGLPLTHMARAYARLAAATSTGGERERALTRIRQSMLAFPWAVGGSGRLSTALMESTGSRLAAKGGAEGLECVAVPGRRLGLAVKCEDGQARAVGPAVIGLLDRLGMLSAREVERLSEWGSPAVRNHAGLEVGRIEATVCASPARTR